jgi:hypothetical protein
VDRLTVDRYALAAAASSIFLDTRCGEPFFIWQPGVSRSRSQIADISGRGNPRSTPDRPWIDTGSTLDRPRIVLDRPRIDQDRHWIDQARPPTLPTSRPPPLLAPLSPSRPPCSSTLAPIWEHSWAPPTAKKVPLKRTAVLRVPKRPPGTPKRSPIGILRRPGFPR